MDLTYNDLFYCGDMQTMSHIDNACHLTKFEGGQQELNKTISDVLDPMNTEHLRSWNAYANNPNIEQLNSFVHFLGSLLNLIKSTQLY